MKKISQKTLFLILSVICTIGLSISCENEQNEMKEHAMTPEQMVARGKYLATIASCNDCHSPKIFTQMGPEVDTTKTLSGHHADGPPLAIDTMTLHPGYGYIGSA